MTEAVVVRRVEHTNPEDLLVDYSVFASCSYMSCLKEKAEDPAPPRILDDRFGTQEQYSLRREKTI